MKNLIITTALILISTILSCKKGSPNGSNVISYRVNGQLVEIKDKRSSFNNTGVNITNTLCNNTAYYISGASNILYTGIGLAISKNAEVSKIKNFQIAECTSITCDAVINSNKQTFESGINSAQFTITNNTDKFIS
jgi:hypothetical protein